MIGAMIIAMLLGPIAGVSLGLVDKNSALVRKALQTLVACRSEIVTATAAGRWC